MPPHSLFTGTAKTLIVANLIGEVRKCDEYFEEGKRRVFDVGFANPDTAKFVQAFSFVYSTANSPRFNRKALCMTGYTVAGVPM